MPLFPREADQFLDVSGQLRVRIFLRRTGEQAGGFRLKLCGCGDTPSSFFQGQIRPWVYEPSILTYNTQNTHFPPADRKRQVNINCHCNFVKWGNAVFGNHVRKITYISYAM